MSRCSRPGGSARCPAASCCSWLGSCRRRLCMRAAPASSLRPAAPGAACCCCSGASCFAWQQDGGPEGAAAAGVAGADAAWQQDGGSASTAAPSSPAVAPSAVASAGRGSRPTSCSLSVQHPQQRCSKEAAAAAAASCPAGPASLAGCTGAAQLQSPQYVAAGWTYRPCSRSSSWQSFCSMLSPLTRSCLGWEARSTGGDTSRMAGTARAEGEPSISQVWQTEGRVGWGVFVCVVGGWVGGWGPGGGGGARGTVRHLQCAAWGSWAQHQQPPCSKPAPSSAAGPWGPGSESLAQAAARECADCRLASRAAHLLQAAAVHNRHVRADLDQHRFGAPQCLAYSRTSRTRRGSHV